MKSAIQLLNAYLDSVRDTETASQLFAPDGALELPYLETMGYTWRAKGPTEVKAFLDNVHALFKDFKFHSRQVFIDLPDQVFAEYEVTTSVLKNGRPFHQLYMGRLVASNGKIKLLREALNTVATERALA